MFRALRVGTLLGGLALLLLWLVDLNPAHDLRGAEAYLSRQDADMALRLSSRALLLGGLPPQGVFAARRVRVLAARQLQAEDFARQELALMRAQCPDQAQTHLLLGQLLLEDNQHAPALTHLERGLEQARAGSVPAAELALPLALRGQARLALGQVEQARQDAQLALSHRPGLAQGHLLLSLLAQRQGRLDLALSEMERAWALAAAGRPFFFLEPQGRQWLARLVDLRLKNHVDPRRPLPRL